MLTMEPDTSNKNRSITSTTDEEVSFSNVTAVAKRWMIDFSFVSLCRYFKEDKFDEFSQTQSTLEAIVEGHCHLSTDVTQKRNISTFLARIMHGKQLDVRFDNDDRVTPLMSATKIWRTLRDTVADQGVFESIAMLLFVQSVAVCLEKGQRSKASSTLKWLQEEHDLPQNFGVKLSVVVKKMDTYHPFLLNFTFSRLLEAVQSYLDAFLEENPSDYLLQAATKVAQSSRNEDAREESLAQDNSLSETTNESTGDIKENKKSIVLIRPKKKLLTTKNVELWKPDSCKRSTVHLKRIAESEVTRLTFGDWSPEKPLNTSQEFKRRKPPQKWTAALDKQLDAGVKRHGEGKWSRILLDYDFEGRTGVMLKDRWRTLKRAHLVG